MTETQKAIEAKMLTEIIEEKDFGTRAQRVDEYRTFIIAVATLQRN